MDGPQPVSGSRLTVRQLVEERRNGFTGGFRAWAARSRRDPLAALSISYDPYWRSLRQVVATMAGIAVTDLPSTPLDPAPAAETEVRTPDPAFEPGGDADALAS